MVLDYYIKKVEGYSSWYLGLTPVEQAGPIGVWITERIIIYADIIQQSLCNKFKNNTVKVKFELN